MQLQSIIREEKSEPPCRDSWGRFAYQTSAAAADATLEFGRFLLSPRRRQLLADGVPVELGTRAFDILMVLIDADGALVTKDELVARVWPRVFVEPTNLKVQVSALRKALGDDRDFILTEFGRGYRFTGTISSAAAPPPEHDRCPRRCNRRPSRRPRHQRTFQLWPHDWCAVRPVSPRR
jgi:DNA-binding winged helix-turn-helix (wHTH) protein